MSKLCGGCKGWVLIEIPAFPVLIKSLFTGSNHPRSIKRASPLFSSVQLHLPDAKYIVHVMMKQPWFHLPTSMFCFYVTVAVTIIEDGYLDYVMVFTEGGGLNG